MRIVKQYAYMLGAYDARIVFPCFNKQFKCVENSHFSTIDYFSVKLAPAVKLRPCLDVEIESIHRICLVTDSVDRSCFGSQRPFRKYGVIR